MYRQTKISLAILGFSSLVSGCSTLSTNTQSSQYDTHVYTVMTEYSGALQCLGRKIDGLDVPPISVYVGNIDDMTVPFRYSARRLSKGGAWWFRTAISKLQTDKVISIVKRPNRVERNQFTFVEIDGAWTQDDAEVGVSSTSLGFSNLGRGIVDKFGWFDREEASVIAGDFVSSVGGKVVYSSAISLAVKENGHEYEIRIDDGSRRVDFGIRSEVNEGPQFAQRRIVEAATLVHISKLLNVDYAECLSNQTDKPAMVPIAQPSNP